jgi:putative phosphoesterase
MTLLAGVLSDTHDRLRPEALSALRRSDVILHAGDVCRPEVLEELRGIAPVFAVRGNNDRGAWARTLPVSRTVALGEFSIFLIHDRKAIDFDPRAKRIDAVVSGHSHRPGIERRNGVLYLNPGSAGPRRFRLPVALAYLRVSERGLQARLLEIVP